MPGCVQDLVVDLPAQQTINWPPASVSLVRAKSARLLPVLAKGTAASPCTRFRHTVTVAQLLAALAQANPSSSLHDDHVHQLGSGLTLELSVVIALLPEL